MTTGFAGTGTDRIAIVPFTPAHLGAVREFSRTNWRRPHSDDYFAWRYLVPQPFSRMVLAMRRDVCVGMLFALRKPYRIGGVRLPCLEVFDWHCLPEVRGSGVGVRLMRAMMHEAGWIVSVSGTDDVIKALTLMGWTTIGASRLFERPMDAAPRRDGDGRRAPVPNLARRLGAIVARRTTPAPPQGTVTRVPELNDEVEELYRGPSGYAIVQEPDAGVMRWMASGAWAGRFERLEYRIDGALRGWALVRVFDWGFGLDGDVVDVFAPRPDPALYAWMVSEAVALLARMPVRRVRARASCPVLQTALVASGFLTLGPPTPVLVRPGGSGVPAGALHITLNHADGPLLPYESDAQIRARRAAAAH